MPNSAPKTDSQSQFDPNRFPAALRTAFREQIFASGSRSELEGLSEADLDRLADAIEAHVDLAALFAPARI